MVILPSSIAARQAGDDFQAYLFWIEACHLILQGEISRVGFEVNEYKAFDDVAAEYPVPRMDGNGGLVDADHWQVKFSATFAKEVTYEALAQPAFINADKSHCYSVWRRPSIRPIRPENVIASFLSAAAKKCAISPA